MGSRLLPLMGILLIAWLLVFLGVYIIFALIVPVRDLFPGGTGALLTSTLKVLASAALVALWLVIMVKLRDYYARRKLFSRP